MDEDEEQQMSKEELEDLLQSKQSELDRYIRIAAGKEPDFVQRQRNDALKKEITTLRKKLGVSEPDEEPAPAPVPPVPVPVAKPSKPAEPLKLPVSAATPAKKEKKEKKAKKEKSDAPAPAPPVIDDVPMAAEPKEADVSLPRGMLATSDVENRNREAAGVTWKRPQKIQKFNLKSLKKYYDECVVMTDGISNAFRETFVVKEEGKAAKFDYTKLKTKHKYAVDDVLAMTATVIEYGSDYKSLFVEKILRGLAACGNIMRLARSGIALGNGVEYTQPLLMGAIPEDAGPNIIAHLLDLEYERGIVRVDVPGGAVVKECEFSFAKDINENTVAEHYSTVHRYFSAPRNVFGTLPILISDTIAKDGFFDKEGGKYKIQPTHVDVRISTKRFGLPASYKLTGLNFSGVCKLVADMIDKDREKRLKQLGKPKKAPDVSLLASKPAPLPAAPLVPVIVVPPVLKVAPHAPVKPAPAPPQPAPPRAPSPRSEFAYLDDDAELDAVIAQSLKDHEASKSKDSLTQSATIEELEQQIADMERAEIRVPLPVPVAKPEPMVVVALPKEIRDEPMAPVVIASPAKRVMTDAQRKELERTKAIAMQRIETMEREFSSPSPMDAPGSPMQILVRMQKRALMEGRRKEREDEEKEGEERAKRMRTDAGPRGISSDITDKFLSKTNIGDELQEHERKLVGESIRARAIMEDIAFFMTDFAFNKAATVVKEEHERLRSVYASLVKHEGVPLEQRTEYSKTHNTYMFLRWLYRDVLPTNAMSTGSDVSNIPLRGKYDYSVDPTLYLLEFIPVAEFIRLNSFPRSDLARNIRGCISIACPSLNIGTTDSLNFPEVDLFLYDVVKRILGHDDVWYFYYRRLIVGDEGYSRECVGAPEQGVYKGFRTHTPSLKPCFTTWKAQFTYYYKRFVAVTEIKTPIGGVASTLTFPEDSRAINIFIGTSVFDSIHKNLAGLGKAVHSDLDNHIACTISRNNTLSPRGISIDDGVFLSLHVTSADAKTMARHFQLQVSPYSVENAKRDSVLVSCKEVHPRVYQASAKYTVVLEFAWRRVKTHPRGELETRFVLALDPEASTGPLSADKSATKLIGFPDVLRRLAVRYYAPLAASTTALPVEYTPPRVFSLRTRTLVYTQNSETANGQAAVYVDARQWAESCQQIALEYEIGSRNQPTLRAPERAELNRHYADKANLLYWSPYGEVIPRGTTMARMGTDFITIAENRLLMKLVRLRSGHPEWGFSWALGCRFIESVQIKRCFDWMFKLYKKQIGHGQLAWRDGMIGPEREVPWAKPPRAPSEEITARVPDDPPIEFIYVSPMDGEDWTSEPSMPPLIVTRVKPVVSSQWFGAAMRQIRDRLRPPVPQTVDVDFYDSDTEPVVSTRSVVETTREGELEEALSNYGDLARELNMGVFDRLVTDYVRSVRVSTFSRDEGEPDTIHGSVKFYTIAVEPFPSHSADGDHLAITLVEEPMYNYKYTSSPGETLHYPAISEEDEYVDRIVIEIRVPSVFSDFLRPEIVANQSLTIASSVTEAAPFCIPTRMIYRAPTTTRRPPIKQQL